jgi:2-dehydropantoate 2-reductase
MATLLDISGELGTSMYFDRLAGRPLEAGALSGATIEGGKRHGIATPLNRALLALLRAINEGMAS